MKPENKAKLLERRVKEDAARAEWSKASKASKAVNINSLNDRLKIVERLLDLTSDKEKAQ